MHDGYLFTLGICGTAASNSPAPALLDAMLAALPPVKRAALLGEVLPMAADGTLHDTLIEPIAADIADAELLIVVTPVLPGGVLPLRLEALLRRMEARYPPPALAGKFLALVGVAPLEPLSQRVETLTALNHLARLCRHVGITTLSPLLLRSNDPSLNPPAPDEEILGLAQHAYAQASAALREQGKDHL